MPLSLVYDQDFSASSDNWLQCLTSDGGNTSVLPRVTDDGAPYVKAVASGVEPWWWDPNHFYPGMGYVNLLAIAYTVLGAAGAPLPDTNYLGGKVVLQARVRNFLMPKSARMVWWFQSRKSDGQTYYNYCQIANPIDEQLGFGTKGWFNGAVVEGVKNSDWTTIEIPFSARNSDWRCYGSSPIRSGVLPLGNPSASVIYGCAPGGAAEAMQAGILDMGVHLIWENTLLGTPRGSKPPPVTASGELHIRRITIHADT